MDKSSPRNQALVPVICAAVLALPATAKAYRTAGDLPQFAGAVAVGWQVPTVEFVVSDQPPTSLSVDDVVRAVDSAATAWGVAACGAPAIQVSVLTSLPAHSGDGRNTIEWVHSGWIDRGFPGASPGATDLLYEKRDGAWKIVEADIYLNAELFNWSKSPGTPVYLDAVVVHELGHALGLLHPCETTATSADPAAPTCTSVAGAIQTTMYPEYAPQQASLSDDDLAGLCFLYPKSSCELAGCPTGSSCVDGECHVDCGPNGPCISGSGELGDPCFNADECATGACVDGRCMQACGSSPGCAAVHCATAPDGARFCTSTLGGLGDACTSAADCLGQTCVQVGNSPALCTRACGSGCPAGWTCASVDDKQVCALEKQVEVSGGGCAFVRNWPSRSSAPACAFLVGVIVAGARRQRRRSRATPME